MIRGAITRLASIKVTQSLEPCWASRTRSREANHFLGPWPEAVCPLRRREWFRSPQGSRVTRVRLLGGRGTFVGSCPCTRATQIGKPVLLGTRNTALGEELGYRCQTQRRRPQSVSPSQPLQSCLPEAAPPSPTAREPLPPPGRTGIAEWASELIWTHPIWTPIPKWPVSTLRLDISSLNHSGLRPAPPPKSVYLPRGK